MLDRSKGMLIRILLILSVVFLSACNSGTSSSNTIQDDQEVDLSSLITTAENDLDNNGVQDQVDEELIARYTNPTEYKQAIHMAKTMQEIINAYLSGDTDVQEPVRNYARSVDCHMQIFGDNSWDEMQIMQAKAFTSIDQAAIHIKMTDKYQEIFNEDLDMDEEACL